MTVFAEEISALHDALDEFFAEDHEAGRAAVYALLDLAIEAPARGPDGVAWKAQACVRKWANGWSDSEGRSAADAVVSDLRRMAERDHLPFPIRA